MKRKIIVNFILLFVMVFVSIKCQDSMDINCKNFYHYYKQAIMKSGTDTIQLIKTLDQVINQEDCLDAYLTRGDIYIMIDSIQKAKDDFKRSLLFDSVITYGLFKIGLIYQIENKEDSAILFFNRALKSKEHDGVMVDYPNSNNELSTNKNRYDVNQELIFYRIALSYYYLNKFKISLDYFNKCIELSYLLDKVYLYRGVIYMELGNIKKACEDFLEARRLGNKGADYYINRHCL